MYRQFSLLMFAKERGLNPRIYRNILIDWSKIETQALADRKSLTKKETVPVPLASFCWDFQWYGDAASPAEGQLRHGDPRDAKSFLQRRIHRWFGSHDRYWSTLYILHANSRSLRIWAVQEEKSAVHDVSSNRRGCSARRTGVPETVLQGFYVSVPSRCICFNLRLSVISGTYKNKRTYFNAHIFARVVEVKEKKEKEKERPMTGQAVSEVPRCTVNNSS